MRPDARDHGLDDTLITPSVGQRIAELVPDAKLLLIEDMGHDRPGPRTTTAAPSGARPSAPTYVLFDQPPMKIAGSLRPGTWLGR